MTTRAAIPLDVFACPLEGANLIEASAGTGKTWAICGLYLRLVLERGLEVPQILVVTFTNAATAELRERIRERMVQVLARLQGRGPTRRRLHRELAGQPAHAPRHRRCRDDQAPGRRRAELRRSGRLHHPRLRPAGAGRRAVRRRHAAVAGAVGRRWRSARRDRQRLLAPPRGRARNAARARRLPAGAKGFARALRPAAAAPGRQAAVAPDLARRHRGRSAAHRHHAPAGRARRGTRHLAQRARGHRCLRRRSLAAPQRQHLQAGRAAAGRGRLGRVCWLRPTPWPHRASWRSSPCSRPPA